MGWHFICYPNPLRLTITDQMEQDFTLNSINYRHYYPPARNFGRNFKYWQSLEFLELSPRLDGIGHGTWQFQQQNNTFHNCPLVTPAVESTSIIIPPEAHQDPTAGLMRFDAENLTVELEICIIRFLKINARWKDANYYTLRWGRVYNKEMNIIEPVIRWSEIIHQFPLYNDN